MTPIKIIRDKRFTYLDNLKDIYQNMGYAVRIHNHSHQLDIYAKGTIIPQEIEEIILDKWID